MTSSNRTVRSAAFVASLLLGASALTGCGSAAGCPKYQSLMTLASCPGGAPVEMKEHYSSVLRGRIVSGGRPVEGATVAVEVFDWGVRKTAESDSQGVFFFEDLRPQTYRLVICRAGHRPAIGVAFIGDEYREIPLTVELKAEK